MTSPTTPALSPEDEKLIAKLTKLETSLNLVGSRIFPDAVASAIARITALSTEKQGDGWVKIHGGMQFPVWATDGTRVSLVSENFQAFDVIYTHYQRVRFPAPPPPELTPEQKQAEEDEKAWEAHCDIKGWIHREIGESKACFLAGRRSLRASKGGVK